MSGEAAAGGKGRKIGARAQNEGVTKGEGEKDGDSFRERSEETGSKM